MTDHLAGLDPRTARKFWHTDDVGPRERFAYFREGLCQTMFAITPEPMPGTPLSASIEQIALPRGSLARLSFSPQTIRRTKENLADISSEYVAIYMQKSGETTLVFDDQVLQRSSGDLVICDVNEPFSLHIRRGRQLNRFTALFARSMLTDIAGSELRIGNQVLFQRPGAPALLTCLSLIERRFSIGSFTELDVLHQACAALVVAHFLQDDEIVASAPAAGLLASVKAYIDQNLSSSDLSPTLVASYFGVSVRYVHKLFSQQNETFGQHVMSERLQRVWRDLVDPSLATRSVSDIAHRSGFYDMSSFYRNFKARFDRAPGTLRTRR